LGQLAKLVREDVSRLEADVGQLPTSDTERLFKDLWEYIPDIVQPFSGELGETESAGPPQRHSNDKEIRGRIARTKGNTAAGPDGVKKDHITKASLQDILRLLYTLITVYGKQPKACRENQTTLLLKQGKRHDDVRTTGRSRYLPS
jgi:hypothetical protein